MTHLELRDLLVNRIGWFNDNIDSTLIVDSDNQTTISGRYFQDEHPLITLRNISSIMEYQPKSASSFNAYLKQLKERCILLVLSDVFKVSDLNDDVITHKEEILDNAILKRMALLIGESILTSTRSNRLEMMTKEFTQNLFYEINGSPQGVNNLNIPIHIGMRQRYAEEIDEIKFSLGQMNLLDTISYRVPNYKDVDKVFFT